MYLYIPYTKKNFLIVSKYITSQIDSEILGLNCMGPVYIALNSSTFQILGQFFNFSVFWSNSSTFQYVGEILLPFIFEASLI